jgi:hypothetical protein
MRGHATQPPWRMPKCRNAEIRGIAETHSIVTSSVTITTERNQPPCSAELIAPTAYGPFQSSFDSPLSPLEPQLAGLPCKRRMPSCRPSEPGNTIRIRYGSGLGSPSGYRPPPKNVHRPASCTTLLYHKSPTDLPGKWGRLGIDVCQNMLPPGPKGNSGQAVRNSAPTAFCRLSTIAP